MINQDNIIIEITMLIVIVSVVFIRNNTVAIVIVKTPEILLKIAAVLCGRDIVLRGYTCVHTCSVDPEAQRGGKACPGSRGVGGGAGAGIRAVGTGVCALTIRHPPKVPSPALESFAESRIICLGWQVPFRFLQAFQGKHDSAI